MIQKLLLIDFENVQQVDLSRLDGSTNIIIFVGASQKSIPIDLVTSAQKLGARVEWQKVEGNGSNTLDFHIACHLGRVLEKSPQFHCIVLSKDKGYDPLLRQLNKIGLKCKRINSMLELDPKSAPVAGPGNKKVGAVPVQPEKKTQSQAAPIDELNYRRVVEILGKSEKKSRPRKLKTLSPYIMSICPKQITEKEIECIIQKLIDENMISGTPVAITYNF